MAEFTVWAPTHSELEVIVNDEPHPMELIDRGWWIADVAEAAPGSDYLFRLDGDEVLPDPRSRYQPEGVRGPSRVVDTSDFTWTDARFQAPPLSSALLYELHVGTFTPRGTFESAIEKLKHLVALGVTHVELMPIAEFAGERGWGYDGVFPYAAHHSYGGPLGLHRLVNACHAEGLAVILDVVYNHLGPSGNCLSCFGPYFTERHKTPWGSAINFDGPNSDEVRQYFIDNAKMWLRDYHIDGLRLDAIHAILDTSAFPFLEQLSEEAKQLEAQLGRHLVLIAESDLSDPRVIRPRGRHGFGFHAQWNDDFHHALHTVLTNESQGYYRDFGGLSDLAHVFRRPYLFARRFSPHRQRSHGRPVDDLEASSFLAYSQNHDQVGNRATGERLHHLLSPEDAKIAAALAILSPYVPMLFQGEEWAASSPFQYFVDFSEDPKLARAVSEGRRKEFAEFLNNGEVPDPQDLETFLRSKLAWEELLEPQHREMLDWYKRLIGVRRRIPALVDGRLDRVRTRYDERAKWLAVEREYTILAANLGTRACTIKTQPLDCPEVLLASKAEVQLEGTALRLPPHSVALACGTVHPTLPSGAAAISLHPNVRSAGAHENVGHR